MKHNLVCIKLEISEEKSVEIKVMVLAWKVYQFEGSIRESWFSFLFGY